METTIKQTDWELQGASWVCICLILKNNNFVSAKTPQHRNVIYIREMVSLIENGFRLKLAIFFLFSSCV